MKKFLIRLLSVAMLLGIGGCRKQPTDDGQRFMEEYEALNNKETDGHRYSEIEINPDSSVRYVDKTDLLNGLKNGTHVIYMGNPECGWCRRAVPVLIEAVNGFPGISIYYYSIKQCREDYEAQKDNENAQLYRQILGIMAESGYDFSGTVDYYDDGSMKLPASLMIFVKGGKIIGAHRRTVQSHLDPYEPLSDAQQEELKGIYDIWLNEMSQYDPVYCSGC